MLVILTKNVQNTRTLFRMRHPICFYNFSSLIDRWEIFYKSKFYLHDLLCIIAILLLPCHLRTGLLSLLWNAIEVLWKDCKGSDYICLYVMIFRNGRSNYLQQRLREIWYERHYQLLNSTCFIFWMDSV